MSSEDRRSPAERPPPGVRERQRWLLVGLILAVAGVIGAVLLLREPGMSRDENRARSVGTTDPPAPPTPPRD